MSTDQQPLHVSKCTARGLWQEYRIFDDRVELLTHFGTMTVPFDEIERAEVQDSDIKGWGKQGQLHLRNFRPALKIDWANFHEHVVLDKTGGPLHRVKFTPDDPAAFVAALDAAVQEHRAGTGRTG